MPPRTVTVGRAVIGLAAMFAVGRGVRASTAGGVLQDNGFSSLLRHSRGRAGGGFSIRILEGGRQ